jgi:hypothetical protein
MRYSTALYLCFATTSTIGYGEYTPDAPLSRATICVYAFLTLAIFSLLIGEVVVPRSNVFVMVERPAAVLASCAVVVKRVRPAAVRRAPSSRNAYVPGRACVCGVCVCCTFRRWVARVAGFDRRARRHCGRSPTQQPLRCRRPAASQQASRPTDTCRLFADASVVLRGRLAPAARRANGGRSLRTVPTTVMPSARSSRARRPA